MPVNSVSQFIDHHYRHFNAAVLKDAAHAYRAHLDKGGQMLLTLAGAMSTAELGLSLAEMIRTNKVSAICCTGANLEEDLFNLVAHDHYKRIPNYRELTAQDEEQLLQKHLNRVTDTCIPEEEAMRRIERAVREEWILSDQKGERRFPHEFLYSLLCDGTLKDSYQIDPQDSWLHAAATKNLPLFCAGVGGFDSGEHLHSLLHHRKNPECSYRSNRNRIYDDPGRVVYAGCREAVYRILSDRGRDCR